MKNGTNVGLQDICQNKKDGFMGSLSVLRQIISKLKKEEQKVARSFLTALSSRGESGPNKSLVLFDFICEEVVQKKEYSIRELELAIYGKSSQAAFPRLILRLKDKVLDSIIVDTNIEREGAYSDRERVLLQIRKNLSHAQIFLNRGLADIAKDILADIIIKANKYEHFEECIAALRSKMQIGILNAGNDSEKVDRELYAKILKSLNAVQKAYDYYNTLIGETEFISLNGEPLFSDLLQRRIDELYEVFRETGSASVAFYLYYIETHHLQLQCRYKAASGVLKEQLNIVEQHPAIHSKIRLAGAVINFAWNELYLYNFKNAVNEIEKAEILLQQGSFNLFQCFEIRFYAYFYMGDYQNALNIVEHLEVEDNSPTAAYRTGKRLFKKACVYFMLKEYVKVTYILRQLNPIEDDSQGWNVGMRVLFIMNDIEQEHTESAVNRIENLRKHLEKLKKKTSISQRNWVKYEILRELINTRFNFTETYTRRKSEIEQLRSSESEITWRILTAEIIPFNQWFDSWLYKKSFKIELKTYTDPLVVAK